jgi:hypothetical protein
MRGKTRWACGVLLVLLLAAGVGWLERVPLQSWYYLHGLSTASEDQRDVWVERVASLGEAAVEGLMDCLGGDDDRACRNAATTLDHLAGTWGCGDFRVVDLAGREARLFGRTNPRAQALILRGMTGWFTGDVPAEGLVGVCSRLLADAAAGGEVETEKAALDLADVLLNQPGGNEAVQPARELVRAALRSAAAENRLIAIRLGSRPGMDLLDSMVGLLRDRAAQVRQAALLAVGPSRQAVSDESLLCCLHDPDPTIRELARQFLTAPVKLGGRGLPPEHLKLGQLLTHPDHRTRLQVLDHLRKASDLDPGLWLRRLSHDPKDSVRAAAVRVMSRVTLPDLSDRLDQMARSDPSPTVAQLAQYYLAQKRSPEPPVER